MSSVFLEARPMTRASSTSGGKIQRTAMNDPLPPPVPATIPTSGLSIASLVLGILTFLTCWLTGIPAIVTGHMALSRIKKSGGTLAGGGMALAGTIIGYVSALILIPALIGLTAPLVMKNIEKGNQAACTSNVREIGQALHQYHIEHGTDTEPYPSDIHQLGDMGILPEIGKLLAVRKRYQGDWLYFSAADSTNPGAPLLISPPIGKKRIVLQVNGTVRTAEQKLVEVLIKSSPTPPTSVPAPLRR